ncbi:MAG: GNAT family N-acetyltransferase [Candidatus Cloacimonetes bacterium]|jgi:RimJ/RimL family protein N-acetyltransferase|nr:GNAT family N-acetyltransferase [Candidatus Cloacimonadota bacterium]MBT6994219.1 GNAT family N-acetyltransferase [Candidatus Cloacimonadota bacterium]MBT7469870.1 GNAT family N-acetyltransferase [Candidatus Cloacimonadota bacterium]
MRYFKKIIGEKCYLSPINIEDAEKYTEWLNDFEIAKYLLLYRQQITMTKEKEILAKMSEKGDFIFAIIDKKTDKLIGNCGFHNINAVNQRAEFGIFIGDKNCQNKGFGTEAGKLLLDFGFNILNLNNILLEVYSFNERAIKAYEKMGFKHIGKQREAKIMTGKKYDKIFMDMLATEFREKNDSKLKI